MACEDRNSQELYRCFRLLSRAMYAVILFKAAIPMSVSHARLPLQHFVRHRGAFNEFAVGYMTHHLTNLNKS